MPPFPGRRTEPAPEAVSLGGCRWPAADCLPRLGAFRLLFRLGGRSERRVGAGVDLPGKFGEGLGDAVDFVADQEGKEKGQDAPQADSLPQPLHDGAEAFGRAEKGRGCDGHGGMLDIMTYNVKKRIAGCEIPSCRRRPASIVRGPKGWSFRWTPAFAGVPGAPAAMLV